MKKTLIRWVILEIITFLAVLSAYSQPVSAPFAPTVDENALLWKISGEDLKTPSYLYGTIHMIPEADYFLTEATEKAFAEATRIAFEIDTEDMMNPMAMLGLLNKMYMNGDTTLQDLLSEEDYAVVAEHFEDIGLPMFMLGRMKPMFLTVLAGEDMADMKPDEGEGDGGFGGLGMMGAGMKSYELELTEDAKEQEKPIVGLETAEFQMSLFDKIPYADQAQMLLEAVKSEGGDEEADSAIEQMVELYTTQDIVGMQTMMSDDPSGIGGYEDVLLLQRNRNWIPVMEELMDKETVFFAVGAGHLAGAEGVIALLRAEGYKVEPIQ